MQPKPATDANLLALPKGTELVGDFRIERVLGAGGFGITYLAQETALARRVTIKEYFPADFAAREGTFAAAPRSRESAGDYRWGLERFIEEAQILARFVHPNIVRVYRYFRANNTGYMVLQFEEGSSFKAWLKGLQRAPRQAELDAIAAPLLDALEVVHTGDFLHRDIAPDNIIIRRDGSPVLIDFGSARGEIASHSKTVSALVKPGYSPYEQYATTSRQQGPWSDIYALGATLYHAISGKRPPDAPSRVVADEYRPAREVALSSYRPAFLDAVDKALALEVAQRPQSIAEWRALLLEAPPKRERGRAGPPREELRPAGRASEGETTRRRAGARAKANRPARAAAANVPEPVHATGTLVPAPPDAPQPKGQLLDFIEALRRQRRQAAPAANGGGKETPKVPKREATAGTGRVRRFRLPFAPSTAAQPARAAVRGPPRPRPIRTWRFAGTRWRSLAFKLLIGAGIASLAIAYQEPVPPLQGRGAVVANQTGDIAQVLRLAGHAGAVTAVGTADEGRWVVSAGSDGTLRIWDWSGAQVNKIDLEDGAVTALAVEGRRALTGHASGRIVLWDLERAEQLASFQPGTTAITALAFTSEPDRFAAANQGGPAAIFDARSPSTPAPLGGGPEAAPRFIAAARASGVLAVAGEERTITLWRADAEGAIRSWRGPDAPITALGVAPSGRVLATGAADGKLRLWKVASSRVPRALRAHEGALTALAFASNERLLSSAGEDGLVRLWDVRGRNLRTWRAHVGAVRALSFAPDGRRLLSAGQDGAIRIFSLYPIQHD
jgi:hypothetical protein